MPPKKGGKAAAAAAKAARTGAGVSAKPSAPTEAGGPHVVLQLEFETMDIMAMCIGRASAYLEDPSFEGRATTFDELVAANAPAIRYAGHNFPYQSYVKACTVLGTLTEPEHIVQRALTEAARRVKAPSQVYIIAYSAGDTKTLAHERLHAVFHFCPDYRARVEGIWAGIAAGQPIDTPLDSDGNTASGGSSWAGQFRAHLGGLYCRRVWLDEFQAIVLNREYECAARTVSLLQSALPPAPALPFRVEKIQLPTRGLSREDADRAFGRLPAAPADDEEEDGRNKGVVEGLVGGVAALSVG